MRHGSILLCALTVSALLITPAAFAQSQSQQGEGTASKAAAPFDPHDLSGVWDFYMRGIPGQGVYNSISKDVPPMTPWAQARYDAAKPGYGPKAQGGGNDPILKCIPSGIPRILFFPQPFEIVQGRDQVDMLFEREHAYRQVWTDGRQHPEDADPTYMGHSIGKWEGDTFVVDSVGFNDKVWLDGYGHQHSEAMHIVEHYKRVDAHTLTLNLTIEDPKAYTTTWVSDTKIYKALPKAKSDMEELFCIADEENAFTDRVRLPAVGQTPKK